MTTGVKICGIRDAATLSFCHDLDVEWVGFVFYPASPRAVTVEQAHAISSHVPSCEKGGPVRVGLFVSADDRAIESALKTGCLDVLQLYDTAERAEEIRKRFNIPVWLAKGVHNFHDLPSSSSLDGYVIEAPREPGDTRPGGLGRTFDWSITAGWLSPCPWLLAGGLTPNNIQQAIKESGASAVDVSSGVEILPGVKSLAKIKEFVENARRGG